jgi:hypothetical protein
MVQNVTIHRCFCSNLEIVGAPILFVDLQAPRERGERAPSMSGGRGVKNSGPEQWNSSVFAVRLNCGVLIVHADETRRLNFGHRRSPPL